MPAVAYLISRTADPLFALFIGFSAAAMRINREEKELGHSTKETLDAGFRYVLCPVPYFSVMILYLCLHMYWRNRIVEQI